MTSELTTTNILSLFQTTKSERQSFVSDVINRIESGEVDPITIHAQVKKLEDIVKSLTGNEVYKKYLVDEVEKNGKKFEAYNAEFSVKEAGVKYDYSQCGDTMYFELEQTFLRLTDVIKARQKFLQNLTPEGIDTITNDGEVVRIYPPSKVSTTTVNVILR